MKDANAKWKSPLTFTHENGYKFYLEVYPNGWGSGQGGHVSVYVSLIGDNDGDVTLDYERDVVIVLLNWRENKNHLLTTVNFNRNSDTSNSSCRSYENVPTTMGTPHFISHSLLYHPGMNIEYIQDDCLRLRVVDVAVYSTPLFSKTPSWQDPHTATHSVCEFTLTEFTKRKQFNNYHNGPSFYTHPHGYKLCIKVYANGYGNGKDTHITIGTYLMKGDFDSHLQWPIEGDIVIEVLNWREDNHHYRGDTIIYFNKFCDISITGRVIKGEYAPKGSGIRQFISHSSLVFNPLTNTEYLQDDCLRLRVVDVAVYSTPLLTKTPSWTDPHTATQSVCKFTLNEFTKRKQFNNVYDSPPFYSHPHGYKLCLKVYANGCDDGKGTHISIYATLMRGDYDDNLKWPFKGDVAVELLNLKDDNHHYRGESFHFNKNDPTTSRVTEGIYAPSLAGWHSFISHSSLIYDPNTNTEYLQDDCLRLRVVDVAIYSTPVLSKTPSWQDPHTATQSVCEFTLTEFTKRKQFNNVYYSPPFYSHPNGYKLCLVVHANGFGEGKDTHISIYVSLMRGDYDDSLLWPFEGDVVIKIMNWRQNNVHYNVENFFTFADSRITSRVIEREYAAEMWGENSCIPHSSLLYNPDTNTEYLQDDCLRVRVVDVAVYSNPLLSKAAPSWQDPHTDTQSVCEFTLTEFTKRKQFNNVYFSAPFYSHPNGYKLCLRVDVNGYGEGKGTHISIYAYLMRGDDDDNLIWPFEADIIVEILNWRENDNHYRGSKILFNKHNNSRVTEQEYAPKARGITCFFAHSSLVPNSDTDRNTEYLQDDCLRLRVVDVAVYSTPLLSKTPSWQDPHTATQSVCEFTLTEFTKRKQLSNDNEYYSPPFYSHPHGYKLCLKVCANGYAKGKGAHISIFVGLMRGDYDHNLQWPFEAEIVVEILNWREDNRHYRGDTIHFNKCNDPDGSITGRVTDREFALKVVGKFCFISHSSLLYNPDSNTEYLQDDCLRLRVNVSVRSI